MYKKRGRQTGDMESFYVSRTACAYGIADRLELNLVLLRKRFPGVSFLFWLYSQTRGWFNQLEWKCFLSKGKCFWSSMNPVDAFLLNASFLMVTCDQEWLELKERLKFYLIKKSRRSVFTNPVTESAAFGFLWRSRHRWSQGISLFFSATMSWKMSQSMLELWLRFQGWAKIDWSS